MYRHLDKPHRGLVPALGGLDPVEADEPHPLDVPELQLPPSPPLPPADKPFFSTFVKTYETNPESMLPGVIEDLIAVARVWRIQSTPNLTPSLQPNANFDVLTNLKITTSAIRSVRNYILSLPDESAETIRANFRPKSLASSAPVLKRLVSQPNDPSDPISLIRRSALEVLTVLRDLEESSRLPLEDEMYDLHSDRTSSQDNPHSRISSPSEIPGSPAGDTPHALPVDTDTTLPISLIKVDGRRESILVWDDEPEASSPSGEGLVKKERWDEKLVLGSGWLYRQDIRLEDLQKEKAVVARYLDAVDSVLFGWEKDGKRGWEKEKERLAKKEAKSDREARSNRRRVSTGTGAGLAVEASAPSKSIRRILSTNTLDAMRNMAVTEEPEEMETEAPPETDGVEEDELPDWAKLNCFTDDPLGQFSPFRLKHFHARLRL
jgi:hypothetical protein